MKKIFVVTAHYDTDESNYQTGSEVVKAFTSKIKAEKFKESFYLKRKKEIDSCVELLMEVEEVCIV